MKWNNAISVRKIAIRIYLILLIVLLILSLCSCGSRKVTTNLEKVELTENERLKSIDTVSNSSEIDSILYEKTSSYINK